MEAEDRQNEPTTDIAMRSRAAHWNLVGLKEQ